MPRRLSWKTASQRRNRPGSCPSSVTTNDTNTLLQQLNPYKTLRRSAGAACTASIQDDNYERNVNTTRLRLSASGHGAVVHDPAINLDSFDNDSLGVDDDLESIISGIEGNRTDATVPALIPPASIDVTVANDGNSMIAPKCGDDDEHDHVQHSSDGRSRPSRPLVAPVDFGNSEAPARDGRTNEIPKNHLDANSNKSPQNESDISVEEGEESCCRDGAATLKQKAMPEARQGPLVSSGFHDSALGIYDKPPGAIMATPGSSLNCAVASINTNEGSNEQSSGEMDEHDSREESKSHNINNTYQRGDSRSIQSNSPKHVPMEPTSSSIVPLTAIRSEEKEPHGVYPFTHNRYPHDTANTFVVANQTHNQADDAISTVTDPTDSPFIFTYKKSGDDDSVSQITSSIAAASMGSSYLQNIPLGSGRRTNGPSWMGGAAGRRMNPRKRGAVVAGSFGRDRTRQGRSVGNSDGTADFSHENGRSNLDEIAYALNAVSGTYRPRRPGNQDFGDLCTIDSEKSGVSRRRSHEYCDGKSNISALGMGGASCGGHSIASASGLSKSSSSGSRGLIVGLRTLARKAQQSAERFFFPTSPKVIWHFCPGDTNHFVGYI